MNKKAITLAIQAVLSAAITTQAFADEAQAIENIARTKVQSTTQNEKQAEEKIEKITVTGSRLRRDSFSVATPLVIMDRDAIEDTGLGSLSEILVDDMPSISEGSSNSNSQSSVQNTGLSTIEFVT